MSGDQGGPAPEDREEIPQGTSRDDGGEFTSRDDDSTGPKGGPAPEDRQQVPQGTRQDDDDGTLTPRDS